MNLSRNTIEEETAIKINYSLQIQSSNFPIYAQYRNKLYDIEHELKYHVKEQSNRIKPTNFRGLSLPEFRTPFPSSFN